MRTIAMLLVLMSASHCSGQETVTENKGSNDEAAARLKFMFGSVHDYEVRKADEAKTPCKLHPEPLLRWNNPVGGVPDGIVVMWKDGVRPVILAQSFLIEKGGIWLHECQSVTNDKFVMTKDGAVLWDPQVAGVKFEPVRGSPDPSTKDVARLVQMRQIAKMYSASDDFKISSSDLEATRHELRVMPNPLYRYADPKSGLIDGAVFSFAHGTDPEVIMLLEAREKDGAVKWFRAFAPLTCWRVRVERGGQVLWQAEERLRTHRPEDAYHNWRYDGAPKKSGN